MYEHKWALEWWNPEKNFCFYPPIQIFSSVSNLLINLQILKVYPLPSGFHASAKDVLQRPHCLIPISQTSFLIAMCVCVWGGHVHARACASTCFLLKLRCYLMRKRQWHYWTSYNTKGPSTSNGLTASEFICQGGPIGPPLYPKHYSLLPLLLLTVL